jgi:ATP-dependent helicase/nuclease subunit A
VRCALNTPANAGIVLDAAATTRQAAPQPSSPARDEEPVEPTRPPGSPTPSTQLGPEPHLISALSYTSLSELERCGYRYYLERVLGLSEDRAAAERTPAAGGLEARARGTLVHRLMETLDFAGPGAPSPQQVAAAAAELGMRAGERDCAEIAALIATAKRAAPAARVADAKAVRREHPFAFSLGAGEPLITGVIDLLADEADGGQLVLDYKSDRVGPEVALADLVERDYAIQRLLYALAVLREGAVSVEIVHWFLERPQEWVGVRYTAAERLELEQQLGVKLARARKLPFAVTRRPHRALCLTCPGRAGLCSWGEAETLREQADELEQRPERA